jgi:hypothetical protein
LLEPARADHGQKNGHSIVSARAPVELCAIHACLDDQALLAAREAIGSSLQTSEFCGWRHDCLPVVQALS